MFKANLIAFSGSTKRIGNRAFFRTLAVPKVKRSLLAPSSMSLREGSETN